MIIGGAQIYAAALPQVTRAYITEVDADIDGDAFFPSLDAMQWKETARENFSACEKNPYNYSFLTLERQ
jgi:dihydrofolate reductase